MKIKSLVSCLLAVIMITAMFAVPSLAAVDERTLQTPYGPLKGLLFLHRTNFGLVQVSAEAELTNGFNANVIIATFEIVEYYTGSPCAQVAETYYNYNRVVANQNYNYANYPIIPSLVTVYGCAEVRHTNSYAVWPRLIGV